MAKMLLVDPFRQDNNNNFKNKFIYVYTNEQNLQFQNLTLSDVLISKCSSILIYKMLSFY